MLKNRDQITLKALTRNGTFGGTREGGMGQVYIVLYIGSNSTTNAVGVDGVRQKIQATIVLRRPI